MVKVRLIMLALVAAFAVSAAAAASASALQWLLNGKSIESPLPIGVEGSLLAADLAQRTALVCEGTSTGSVGPLAKAEVKTITAQFCRFQAGLNGPCEASGSVTARVVNLPWLTLLLAVSGQTRDYLYPHPGGGNPGWLIECRVAGILDDVNECTLGADKPLVLNAAKGVTATFEEAETGSCSKGTATSGMLIGSPLILSPTGGTLTVSNSSNR